MYFVVFLSTGLIFLFSFLFDCYHKMVSPQNGDTRGGPPPPLATPLNRKHVTAIPAKTLPLRVFIGQDANC